MSGRRRSLTPDRVLTLEWIYRRPLQKCAGEKFVSRYNTEHFVVKLLRRKNAHSRIEKHRNADRLLTRQLWRGCFNPPGGGGGGNIANFRWATPFEVEFPAD